MPWFMIDDGFWSHPKTLQLSDGAQALWMRAGSWSMKHLTDGHIPDYALPILSAKPRYVEELRSVSLWFSVDDGNQFHDWLSYQRSREVIEEERRASAERKRKSRGESRGESRRDTGGDSPGGVTPPPALPFPTNSSSTKKREPAKGGSRLSEQWLPTAESVAVIKKDAPDVDSKAEHPTFVDYWIAQPGQKGVKTNWDATWRNWMRRKQSDIRTRPTRLTPMERAQKTLTLATDLDLKEISA